MNSFDVQFEALTGFAPMPWQEALYERLIANRTDNIPASCNLPTGLGKTAVVAIWLIALAKQQSKMPRRLIYVVNRRTVVDQTTVEVENIRDRLLNSATPVLHELTEELRALSPDGPDHRSPLAISTLRGQFADNGEWSADPSVPAVICGTVDMIGSRLLFSGYRIGFRSRPLHAGFLGQDVLLVHDEAHLEPAFQELLVAIENEQKRCCEFARFQLMELSATSRSTTETFGLTDKDHENAIVKKRLHAKKTIQLHENDNAKKLGDQIGELATKLHRDSGQAILIFVRKVEDVDKVTKRLPSGSFAQLTGTIRGLERDGLVKTPIFQRFLPLSIRDASVIPAEGTVYLVCTSAGEVGVNISADHLVCDLSTFESMAQRFGRVNRFGEPSGHIAQIDIVCPTEFDETDELEARRQRTLELLRELNGNASPAVLAKLDAERRIAAFAPPPILLPVTDILLDAWALTTIRESMPGRPPVAPYLHGLEEWQPPETYVAWRKEVGIISGGLLDQYEPETLLEAYPLKPQELLRDRSDRVFDKLQMLARRNPDLPIWVIDEQGNVLRNPRTGRLWLLGELADPSITQAANKKSLIANIADRTVLLPPSAGGLNHGMLDGESIYANDVSRIDDPASERRIRVWSDDSEPPDLRGMRLVRSIVIEEDGDGEPKSWNWYKQKPFEDARTAQKPVRWEVHVGDVERHADRILSGLRLPDDIAAAIRLAAKLHDHGKRRLQFQFTLGNRTFPELVLAKSGRAGARLPEPYRHEFGSLTDAANDPEFQKLSPEMQDLVLHLIAAHHGRARPSFSPDEVYDPDITQAEADVIARETLRRFARLQRKFGRWGLAYLESLLRAADWAASADPSEFVQSITP